MSENRELELMKKEHQFTLSKLSHEIRNPVTLINSFLQLMAKKYPQVEELDYWDDIQENMTYLIDLLGELSAYNSAARLKSEPVDIHQFMESIAKSLFHSLNYLGIELELTLENIHPILEIDKIKFRQTILNIIKNATDAVGDHGKITISLRQTDSHVEIAIADDGEGIPEEYLSTLFEPFVTHKKDGSGLGLAIARQVIEAHGGNIRASSVPGEGATFLLSLPLPSGGTTI